MRDKIHYTELGLVNTRDMFKQAFEGRYAVPAYNFNNMEQLQAIVTGCVDTNSPVILQVSGSARKYADPLFLPYMVKGAVQLARSSGQIPMALHLDHGNDFDLAKSCIESGFSSVMIDGSHHPFDENVRITREVVSFAHQYDVSVEGELGVLAGVEDEVSSEVSHFTQPDEVAEFVNKTGVDSLAISIGTSHGAHKFRVGPDGKVPPLRFDILEAVEKNLPGFPIVLHGASSVTPIHVEMINRFGGKLESAVGVPEAQLKQAAQSAVCKINIDSDGRLAMTAMIRQVFAENPSEFDPRKYLGKAKEELIELVKYKNINVLGSAGKA